jgi:GcrA cell cycle regulator
MNVNINVYWTEERVKRAAKLWSDGLSAAAIAERLGGVSRNAVIGKAYRHPEWFPPRGGVAPRIERSLKAKPAVSQPKAQKSPFRADNVRKPARLPDVPISVPVRPSGAAD